MNASDIVHNKTWKELLDVVPSCDLICVDAPYSEKTHKGHDAGALTANRAAIWGATAKPTERSTSVRHVRAAQRYAVSGGGKRERLSYAFWTPADVDDFVDAWAPRTSGWFVSLTDDQLAPVWAAALARHKRLVFSPLACVEPGSRVRMTGDGPSQWACFAIVARPRKSAMSKWGTLPGAYVVPPGFSPRAMNGGKEVTGGKPAWLMERLVEDYSRPGDLVCDPCCGAGTGLVAAIKAGRRAIGGDMSAEHTAIAREAVQAELDGSTLKARRAGQVALFGNGEVA